MRSTTLRTFDKPSTIVVFASVEVGGDYPQVGLDVQPANIMAAKRNNVVNVVRDARIPANSTGFPIYSTDGRPIGPRRYCENLLQLPRLTSCVVVGDVGRVMSVSQFPQALWVVLAPLAIQGGTEVFVSSVISLIVFGFALWATCAIFDSVAFHASAVALKARRYVAVFAWLSREICCGHSVNFIRNIYLPAMNGGVSRGF
jgi:hypothetical protein